MDSIGFSSILASTLMLISSIAITEGDGVTGNIEEDCAFRGDMCAVNASCIELLRKSWLVENCYPLLDPPQKSLYIEEPLSFQPHPYTVDYFLAKNWTYSVFLSDNFQGDNLQLVDGCCNVKGDDKCSMPATFDKEKTFLVVFPYSANREAKYCWNIVKYWRAPMDVCKNYASEITHPCISLKNGRIAIKTRYQPLGVDVKKPYDRCYFTVTKHLVQASYNTLKPEERFLLGGAEVSKDVDGSGSIQPTIRINTTKFDCQVRTNISHEANRATMSSVYNKQKGGFVCYIIKLPASKRYSNFVICEKMPVSTSPVPIIPIAVSLGVVFILLIFIGFVKVCRIGQKLNEKFKISVISGIAKEDLIENIADTNMISDSKQPDEVCFKIENHCDDIMPTSKPEIPFEVGEDGDTPSRMEFMPVQYQDAGEEHLERLVGNSPAPATAAISGQSDEASDIHQSSVKLNQRLDCEPNPDLAGESDGYMPKPQTIIQPSPRKYEEPDMFSENMFQVHIKKDGVKFESGYTPKYITKNVV